MTVSSNKSALRKDPKLPISVNLCLINELPSERRLRILENPKLRLKIITWRIKMRERAMKKTILAGGRTRNLSHDLLTLREEQLVSSNP